MSEFLTVIRPSPRFHLGLKELWDYRELIISLVEREIKVRYKQTLIGVLWVVIQPLATMTIFTLFFGRLAKIPSGELPYPIFALSGVILWSYFASALSGASHSLVEHKPLLSKIYFPRLALPLSAVCVGVVDFGINLILLITLMIGYGVTPHFTLIFAPIFLVLTMLTALSVGLWLAALNAFYRDVRYVIPFLIQLWMFASPVVYPSSIVPERWQWVFALNPMVGLIEGFRWCISGHGALPSLMLFSMGVILILLIGGIAYFRHIERTLADWI
ncbi:MAG: ABC transporter permease [Bacteroidia bacterium]|nr:ABC transporter permease [Bacteroidia bacterium]MDW8015417.1 ABC transporter permease [Bacteroidia bacterium]